MDEDQLETSISGKTNIRHGNIYLHSKYDPLREAERFISARDLKSVVCCILIAPGLHYISDFIQSQYTQMKILIVHPSVWYKSLGQRLGCNYWYPDESITISDFVSTMLSDVDATLTELVVWPPGAAAYPDFCDTALIEVSDCLKNLSAGFRTSAFFGRRWLKNSILNSSYFGLSLLPCTFQGAAFLAASGPGLLQAIPLIRKHRSKIMLWALPSSIAALVRAEITPDCIVTSDAGYWAARHLLCIPDSWFDSVKIFAPVRAMLRPLFSRSPQVFLYASSDRWDREIFDHSVPIVPDRGTVSASAMELLVELGCSSVFIAGLDFSYLDLQSHIRPHTFEYVASVSSSRLAPEYSSHYFQLHNAGAFPVYKSWWSIPSLMIYLKWYKARQFDSSLETFDFNPNKLEKGLNSASLNTMDSVLSESAAISDEDRKSWLVFKNRSMTADDAESIERKLLDFFRGELSQISLDQSISEPFYCLVAPISYRNWRRALVHENSLEVEKLRNKLRHDAAEFLDQLAASVMSAHKDS